jgi:acetoin utilization protein AcuB
VRRLPVVNRRGELVGIIPERVILRAMPSDATTLSIWEERDMVRRLTVSKFMTENVVTVTEDTPIEEAACMMVDRHFSGLPVLRNGSLVGFITDKDIFTTLIELMGARDEGVRLTAMVEQRPGVLMSISKAIYEAGGNVIALGTTAGETTDTAELMIKVSERLTKTPLPAGCRPISSGLLTCATPNLHALKRQPPAAMPRGSRFLIRSASSRPRPSRRP